MSNRRGRGNRNKRISIDDVTLKNIIKILILLIILAICTMGIVAISNFKKEKSEEVTETVSTEEHEEQKTIFQSAIEEFEELNDYKSDSLIRISAVGNILTGDNMIKSGQPYNNIFDSVSQYLNNTDLTLATYETDARGEKQEFAKYVRKAGVNYASLAHNHALDYGNDGLRETNDFLNSIGIQTVGIEGGTSQDRVKIFEKKNVKIAILAYTYDNKKEGVNIYSEDTVKEDLEYAKNMADISIVMMHWGDINSSEVTSKQEEQAKFLVDNGADIILGAHPSVVQKMEMMKNGNGDDCLVAYSLGNFTSETKTEKSRLEMVLNLQIYAPAEGKAKIYKVDYTPLYMLDNGSKFTESRYRILDLKFEIQKYEEEDSDITKTLYNKLKSAIENLNKILDKETE